jgi:8-oxo-dGTP pyrophosphatase MutT (NUDIX family)
MTNRRTRYQAAIVHNHCVLLLKGNDCFSGQTFWVIPGGGREAHESEEACVQREVREETHLEVEVLRLLMEESDPSSFYDTTKTYLCRMTDGEPAPGVEPEVDSAEHTTIQAVAWFDLRQPTSWDPLARNDAIMFPLLQRLRTALGYAVDEVS